MPSAPDWTTFCGFCDWLGVELTPGQREIASVLYDGAEPVPDGIFTWSGRAGPVARGVVAAVCGGRGGKSYVLISLRMLWGALVRDLSTVAPGERAVSLVVAPDMRLAKQAVNYVRGAMQAHPELRHCIVGDRAESISILRAHTDGAVVNFEALPATRGGSALRGRSLTDAALDECAFFRDSSYSVNDEELFRAVSPRVLRGGQVILASTPWSQSGLLYDIYTRNANEPITALAVRAPTLYMRDTPHTQAYVARERDRDPDNARREFDADFMTAGTREFFDRASLDAAVTDDDFEVQPGDVIVAGADLGFRSDSSALVIAAKRSETVHVLDVLELRPDDGPLKPSEVVEAFAKACKVRGARYVMADGHYRETLTEYLTKYGLSYAAAPTKPADAYVRTRVLLRSGRVRMPHNQRLMRQLREVEGTPQPGGGIGIRHPRWKTGGHGDLAAAFVLAMHQAGGAEVKPPAPEMGTREWEESQRKKRRRAVREHSGRAWWKR